MRVWKSIFATGCLMMALVAKADETFIRDYFTGFSTLEANFTQTVSNRNSQDVSKGKLWLQKREYSIVSPKFYFDYESPYAQKLISNKTQFWHYDVDLMQVIIKPLDEINNNPVLTILHGNTKLDDHFTIETITDKRHYRFIPKEKKGELEVEEIDIYFSKNGSIASFEARDITGQRLFFEFNKVKENRPFDQARFEFVPPKNVDVIDERE
ncbi:MAG: outer membrane lipoprotein chaperone LolA [Xanthomonadaceae bacterium]|nr:outer membrane lipoprotein chaperone LolA [Xanthomonadaceae bacterium]